MEKCLGFVAIFVAPFALPSPRSSHYQLGLPEEELWLGE